VKNTQRWVLKKLQLQKDLKNLEKMLPRSNGLEETNGMMVEDENPPSASAERNAEWCLTINSVPSKVKTFLKDSTLQRILNDANRAMLQGIMAEMQQQITKVKSYESLNHMTTCISKAIQGSDAWALLSEGGRAQISATLTGEEFHTEVMDQIAANIADRTDKETVSNKKPAPASSNTPVGDGPKPTIKVIGKIHIPKKIYNFLTLGFNFSLENAQAPLKEKDKSNRIKTIYSDLQISDIAIHEINEVIEFVVKTCKVEREQVEIAAWNLIRYSDRIDKIVRLPTKEPYRKLLNWLISKQVVIKQADKNAGLTAMPVKWYTNRVKDHLSNEKIYKRCEEPNQRVLNNRLTAICKLHKVENKWTTHDIVDPYFYAMPKLHKLNIPIRPIIPSHSWVTTSAAKWLHEQLYPLVQTIPWIITDRLQFIEQIEKVKIVQERYNIATMDVTALYTNIELNDGITKIQNMILEGCTKPTLVIDLLKFVLTCNYFKFGDQWYQQIHGAAMGGNVSCDYADLVLAAIEKDTKVNGKLPETYLRYRDDIFTGGTIKQLQELEKHLNRQSTLVFNLEQLGRQVNFLDVTIYKSEHFKINGKLLLKPFVKPTNARDYTHPGTYKPDELKHNWIVGETIRILRGSSTAKDYNREILKFKQTLAKRGYSRTVIWQKCKYTFEDRNWLITKTDKTMDKYKWWPRENKARLHQSWNYSQDTLKPILEYYGIKTTVKQVNTVANPINGAAKRVVNTYQRHRRSKQSASIAPNTIAVQTTAQAPPTNAIDSSSQDVQLNNPLNSGPLDEMTPCQASNDVPPWTRAMSSLNPRPRPRGPILIDLTPPWFKTSEPPNKRLKPG
jgi:heme oxygenase